MSADVVVVGAGLGGLCAAITLQARGVRVRVLESAAQAGGKAGVERVDGVEFDTGPSVLTLPEVLDGVLRLGGTSLRDELTLTEPSPAFRYLYPDGARVDVHLRPDDTIASVAESLGPEAARELRAFLDYAKTIWDSAAPYFVFGDAPSVGGMLRLGPAAIARVAKVDALRSMQAAIESRVRSPHLRTLLLRYATYNGSDARRTPATMNCIAHVELDLGGYGVRGGIHELVRALVRTAERLGVELELGARVAQIQCDRGRVRGVETEDGRVHACEAVVANADVAHVVEALLPEPLRAGLRVPHEPSMSGWTAVVRAKRRPRAERVAHTVLFPHAYLHEFADLFDRDRPPTEPTVYLCAQEAAHERTGWAEQEPVFLMANAPPEPRDGERDPAVAEALRETTLRRARQAGLIESTDEIVWERTPAGLAARFPGTRGAIYGASSNGMLAAFQRPPNRAASIRGLYFASGSAHPGGGMPLCMLSGRRAAEAVLADGLAGASR